MRVLGLALIVLFTLAGCGKTETVFTLDSKQASKTKQVVLFFSLACPHCKKFDEVLEESWLKTKHEDVVFERIPVLFGKTEWLPLIRAYTALRVMGVQDAMTSKLFEAIHEKNFDVYSAETFSMWMASHGFDPKKVKDAYNSQDAAKYMNAYAQAEAKYQVMSIPRLIINGNRELYIGGVEGEKLEDKAENTATAINYELSKQKQSIEN